MKTTAPAGTTAQQPPPEKLIRIKDVLELYQVSRAHWYDGIKLGRYPAPIKLSERIAVWRYSDIQKLIEQTIHQASQNNGAANDAV